ncbi:MAG: prolipoprotein diacylglyceryl transferase [Chloroherpetonaceae bacterium]|nr:prolipoprotein diacylglyceryl transferase [Chloroherpetonaceae bacterium]
MYPVIYKFGPITLNSFGAMLVLAFLTASFLLEKELERKKLPIEAGSTVTLISIFLGILGSKLFHLFENFSLFLDNPFEMIFNASGLTFYGGLILAISGNVYYLKKNNIPLLPFFDAAAPSLMIAYGIGRIGCLLAGDGCYGDPTLSQFGMTFPNGIISTLSSVNLELAQRFAELYPKEPIPKDIPVHPTPIYEFFYSLGIFGFLWLIRTASSPAGKLFAIYLILQAAARFFIEFIRLNDLFLFGFTQAQVISIGLFLSGLGMLFIVSKRPHWESLPDPVKKKVAKKN